MKWAETDFLCNDPLMIAVDPSLEASMSSDEAYCLAEKRLADELPELLENSDAEWIYLYLSSGQETDPFLRTELFNAVDQDDFDAALYDESWSDGASLRYAKSDELMPYSAFENGPSNLLIRRGLLLTLLKNCMKYEVMSLTGLVMQAVAQGIPLRKLGKRRSGQPTPGSAMPVLWHCRNQREDRANKRILVVTHELSRSGAPLVLAEACINVLRPHGYQMMVVSPIDGPVADMYLENGVSVLIQPDLLRMDSDAIVRLALGFDLVFVCTIVPYACIWMLNGIPNIQVMWWLHDCKLGYTYIAKMMPESLEKNVHVYCGGQYEMDVLQEFCPSYEASVLLYGVKDRNPEGKLYKPGNTPLQFAIIASIENRKGQDILAKAIELLDDQTRKQCRFLFVGNVLEESVFEHVEAVVNRYPKIVTYRKNIPREELDGVYQKSDCIICSSRDDPMPAFVTEAMMFGRPIICSEHTGSADVIKDDKNGFIYHNDDPKELARCITKIVRMNEKRLLKITKEARRCYEVHFTIPLFEKNLLKAVEACLSANPGAGRLGTGEKVI